MVEVLAAAAADQANNWTTIGLVIGGIVVALGGGEAGVIVQKKRSNRGNGDDAPSKPCPLHKGLEMEINDLKKTCESTKSKVSQIMFFLMKNKGE